MSRRIQRVNELLKQEVSNLILRELDFSKEVMITVTGVKTSSDLRQARIRVSIMPLLRVEKVLKVLDSKIFDIQKLLNKKLKMKIVPKIRFELDKSEEKVNRVEQLLKKLDQ